ncbi:MAG: hypothetical protein JXR68_06120 [Bacteroidales bacterium]|nr:hypothetical protein [Bacteroidales bacterium]
MRNFIVKLFVFISLFLIFLLGVIGVQKKAYNNDDFFKLPVSKNVLILGDSHAEYSFNDTIYKNAINLAQSADAFFYSYIKLVKFAENNNIDTVILSVSYHNLIKEADNWCFNEEYMKCKIPKYLFFF